MLEERTQAQLKLANLLKMVPDPVSILSNSNLVVLAINLVLGLTTDVNLLLTHGQMAHVLTHL